MDLISAEELALDLIDEHLDTDLWSFKFDGAKRRFGRCRYPRGYCEADGLISLSRPLTLINNASTVTDVILHEIAHALAGTGAGHGPRWQAAAIAIGAKPERCYDIDDVNTPKANYHGECPRCGKIVERFRITDKAKRSACYECCHAHNYGRYDDRFKYVWKKVR